MTKEITRALIVRTANNLFSRFGYHKTSMDDIVRASKKSKGSIYYHFTNKEELFREVVINEKNAVQQQLEIAMMEEALIPSEQLLKYLIKRMEVIGGTTNYLETLKADFFEQNNFIADIREDYDEWEKKKIKAILVEGVNSKEFKEIEAIDELINVILVVLKAFEIPFYVQDNYENQAPQFERLMQIIIRGLKL